MLINFRNILKNAELRILKVPTIYDADCVN